MDDEVAKTEVCGAVAQLHTHWQWCAACHYLGMCAMATTATGGLQKAEAHPTVEEKKGKAISNGEGSAL